MFKKIMNNIFDVVNDISYKPGKFQCDIVCIMGYTKKWKKSDNFWTL
jgi:hypothetical protein